MPPLTLFAYQFTSMDHTNDNSYYTFIKYFVNIQKMGIVCFVPYLLRFAGQSVNCNPYL
jgi:hypothetical protein